MKLELVSSNKLRTNRYITDYGMTTNTFGALTEVDLVVTGSVEDKQGFTVDMMTLRYLFYEIIGDCWDRGILIQKGQTIPYPTEALIYVDFSPSLENIAKEIYECLAPIIDQRYHVCLTKVVAKSDLGAAAYGTEGGHHHRKREEHYPRKKQMLSQKSNLRQK